MVLEDTHSWATGLKGAADSEKVFEPPLRKPIRIVIMCS